jgi:hypothetical protein
MEDGEFVIVEVETVEPHPQMETSSNDATKGRYYNALTGWSVKE